MVQSGAAAEVIDVDAAKLSAPSSAAAFEAAAAFAGPRPGTTFRLGPLGLGYYAEATAGAVVVGAHVVAPAPLPPHAPAALVIAGPTAGEMKTEYSNNNRCAIAPSLYADAVHVPLLPGETRRVFQIIK